MTRISFGSKLAALLGTTSLLTTLWPLAVRAGEMMAQGGNNPEEIPENVLITGSLIHGTAAVGVPVTNLSPMDFAVTGAVKLGDLFKDIPQANVSETSGATYSGGHLERETRVNLRGLDQTGPRSLMMIDGYRFPPQADGICAIDPSIIPALALDHVDILADGASATYGSDAIAGVINIILKRNFDGAITQLGFSDSSAGKLHYLASQLWGRTWDGGQITLTYEWYDDGVVTGKAHSNYSMDYRPWGLDDRRPTSSSNPGTVSIGAEVQAAGTASGTNCTNCVAIPHGYGGNFDPGINGFGPIGGSTAATFDWLALNSNVNYSSNASGNPATGMQNVRDPLKLGWEDPAQQRTAAVMTVDQRLTKDISFFGEAFYSNRRNELLDAPNQTPTNNVALAAIRVPTWNPYYPTNAPTDLRVAYNLSLEHAPWTTAYEVSLRYAMGINVALPADWTGQVYYSESSDASHLNASTGAVNKNAVSAALGWTVAGAPATGKLAPFGTWTKPANIPYLNLFCDSTMFQCNSPDTIGFMTAGRQFDEKMWNNEKGVRLDGPLFDLPGGTVKAAIGASYNSVQFHFLTLDNSGGATLDLPPIVDAEPYHVWAVFTQVNIPIFGDQNSLPLLRRFDVEASWRHDQYGGTLTGGTSNPKIGFTWILSEDAGLSIKGAWGTSFRFANAGEYSQVASTAIGNFNLPSSLGTNAQPATIGCGTSANSGAGKLLSNGGSTIFNCTSANAPGGLSLAGAPFQLLRPGPSIRPQENFVLKPESASNYAIGLGFAPTAFLKGLDLQVTYYNIRIAGVLNAFNNQNTSNFNDPNQGFHFIVPSDLVPCQGIPNVNANPTSCAAFETMVDGILFNSRNAAANVSSKSSIYFINDGGTVNNGVRNVDGIDWNWSYDWDWGDWGAWNVGQSGTYYLGDSTTNFPGTEPQDRFRATFCGTGLNGNPLNPHNTAATDGTAGCAVGVATLPKMRYRARLGWSEGSWSVTGFVNYASHYFHTQPAPPNVNGHFCMPDGIRPGGTSQCAIGNYSNIQPPWYSFDLSIGYDTGETPTNEYLRHIGLNVVIQNILDKNPEFQYGPSNSGRSFAAYDILRSNEGRVFNFLVTKTW